MVGNRQRRRLLEKTWRLRREWSRAFAVMLALLLGAAAATIVGVRSVVGQVQRTATELHRESLRIATLRAIIISHEEVGHLLLSGDPVNRSRYLSEQGRITSLFEDAERFFPEAGGMRATVYAVQRSWQSGLQTYGLWGAQARTLTGNHSAENPRYGASSDATVARLNGLEIPALNTMDAGLARGADLETSLIAVLSALFVVALATTAYYRRRMARDVMRPVAELHRGVLQLKASDFDHRIEVNRRDELGELAEAFNSMAGALRDSHEALTLRATRDTLTGLLNRAAFTEHLADSFAPGVSARSQHESVLFIDIDDFKDINDSLGHAAGDVLLIQLAARLTECVRSSDLVARLGGDEFAVVIGEDEEGAIATEVAGRILEEMRTPFVVNDVQLMVTVSIGVAQRDGRVIDTTELLRNADFAMYMAKGAGKGRYEFFDAGEHQGMFRRGAPVERADRLQETPDRPTSSS